MCKLIIDISISCLLRSIYYFIFNKKKFKYLIFYLHICNFIRSKLRVIARKLNFAKTRMSMCVTFVCMSTNVVKIRLVKVKP